MNNVNRVKAKVKNYKRILIIRLDRIGDVLLSTPVITALRDAYPESFIACMVRPYAADIVAGNPYLDDVIVYDKDGRHHSWWRTVWFALRLRHAHFDCAIILHPTKRSHLIAYLAGIPARIGYDRNGAWMLTRRIPHTKQFGLQHERDYALDVVRAIGIEPKDKRLYMPIRQTSELAIESALGRAGIEHCDTVIVLHPGASCISKRWPAEHFALLGDRLATELSAKIVIIAGHGDEVLAGRVAGLMHAPALNMAGRTSVSEMASMLKRARLFISNDSGPVHIASAVGTPVVVLFGRSDRGLSPHRWGPLGAATAVLHKNVGCIRCRAHNCRNDFKCLRAISVEEVLAAAHALLAKEREHTA